MSASFSPPSIADAPADGTYRCGTLTYSKRQLGLLFFWLLWGDFCYVLMESVVPSIMPLKFKALHASDTSMGMLLVTIPMLLGTVFNPIISFRSDRHRGRWGRRIPFILYTVPFLVICLIGLGFGDSLGFSLRNSIGWLEHRYSPDVVAVGVIGVIVILFSFFNTFLSSTFWYLFNDVVPEGLLARFMSWFRAVSLGSASLYNFFIFPQAETHYRAILIGAGILYFVGFGLMCLNVKEGQYPPPLSNLDGSTGFLSAIKTFAQECHSHWHYWYLFLGTLIGSFSGGMATFMVFFYKDTGLNLDQIGALQGTTTVVTAVLILGSGWLADRIHPMRVVIIGSLLQAVVVLPVMCVWIFWRPAPNVAFLGWMVMSIGLSAPAAALIGVFDPPLLMRLFPRSNYGQFCSANAMWRALGGIFGGVAAGAFLDLLRRHGQNDSHVYTFIPVWQFVFNLPATVLTYKLFQSWKHYGGDLAYQPPLPSARTVLQANVPAPLSIPGVEGMMHSTDLVIEAARSQDQEGSSAREEVR